MAAQCNADSHRECYGIVGFVAAKKLKADPNVSKFASKSLVTSSILLVSFVYFIKLTRLVIASNLF